MTLYWSCAQTHPREEGLALRNLKRQRFNAFYPYVLEKDRFRRLVPRPIFPTYVFIELNDALANWSPINSTLGVKRLLTQPGTSEYRQPAKIGFIENLQKLQMSSPAQGSGQAVLPPGTMVKITRGPFAERVALVEMSTADRVQLLLEAFNRQISVEFAVTDVVMIRRPTGAALPVLMPAYNYG